VAPFRACRSRDDRIAHSLFQEDRPSCTPIRQLVDLSGKTSARDRRIAALGPAVRPRRSARPQRASLLPSRKAGDLEESAAHTEGRWTIEGGRSGSAAVLSQPSEIVRVTQDAWPARQVDILCQQTPARTWVRPPRIPARGVDKVMNLNVRRSS
jgi:hypothetical protein